MTTKLPFRERMYFELSGERSVPLKVHEWEVTGGMLPVVRQSKRTEGVLMSTVSSGVRGGRTKAAPPVDMYM